MRVLGRGEKGRNILYQILFSYYSRSRCVRIECVCVLVGESGGGEWGSLLRFCFLPTSGLGACWVCMCV